MRAIRVAPLALSGATVLLLASPAAHAAQDGGSTSPFTPTVTPSVISPGGQVTLGSGGCSGGATVTSGVFDTALISSGSTTAVATVDRDAQRGAIYAVTFRCGSSGDARNVSLTVTGGATTSASTTAPATAVAPVAPVTPVIGTATALATAGPTSSAPAPAGVQGGLGGSIGSLDRGELAAGAALVLVAVGSTVLFARRRGAGRH
ncbi:hypothetical protein [Streptomyces sp. NBC_00102]|uniref:hypothetical protein n=1 Tax=Streptomyces sp. NBC_00102 TaxID=2975652 RepID=UPI00225ACB05|nr:hypothetical protein [Streptomyces sp. NBC_00102]MCX5402191.1 hypothetical protein [Streptomyces sp. NBC_00102]